MDSEELIQAVGKVYSDLRQKNPDRDEHWLLASTWLERYGCGEEAKEKGAEWARFTAYKDTIEFSMLDSPDSARALALFLAFKELGEDAARRYEREFFQLMQPVMRSRDSRLFIEEYKKKNPQTWEEVQAEDNSEYSLYWFFRGLELEQERDEDWKDEFGDFDLIDILSKTEEEETHGD